MSRRRAPRPASAALRAVREQTAPKTRLAATQSVWEEVVGTRIAAAAHPLSEHNGEITIGCQDTVWMQELDLMQEQLQQGLRERMGDEAPSRLRFRVKDA